MDNFIIFGKCILLYLVALIPLLCQLHGYDAYHIGNMAGYRVAGLSLAQIFFKGMGIPIPMLSLSLQYDIFKNDIRSFKLLHILFIATLTPLVYLYTGRLTGSDSIALVAATLYGISFNFPINLNWLVQPEHYELFFTLLGGTLAMIGVQTGLIPLACAGAMLLGLSQLCKFPALLSVWTMGYLFYSGTMEGSTVSLVIGFYLAPAFIYFVTKKMAFVEAGNRATTCCKGSFFSSVFGYYYYRYKIDPQAYIKSMFTGRAKDYIAQHLFIIFLAGLFFVHANSQLTIFYSLAILFLSLIFLLRMTLWYTQSVTIILCIIAGYGLASLVTSNSTVQVILLCATIPISYKALTSYPHSKRLFNSASDVVPPLQGIATHMAQKLAENETWFFNVNDGYSFVYLLAGRGLPNFFCHVMMGAYGPKINLDLMPLSLYQEGADIVSAFCKSPPTYVVQSLHESTIINLFYLEITCGISYELLEFCESFAIYHLAEGYVPQPFDPEKYNARLLFDSDLAKRMMDVGINTYLRRSSIPQEQR